MLDSDNSWLRRAEALLGSDWREYLDDDRIAAALRRDAEATRAFLEHTLGLEEARRIVEDLGDGQLDRGIFWTRPDPALPEIILLHGVLAGHLANQGPLRTRVWLNPATFVLGDVAEKLRLRPDGLTDAYEDLTLQPDGHLWIVYGGAARRWRKAGLVVHEFSYDWRKSVEHSAERLHHFIETLHAERPGRRFALVAHSMGGLVAAAYADRHARWERRVQQAVLLGAPLGGSYAVVEAVTGTWLVLRVLALVSHNDDLPDLRASAASYPGLLEMLPSPALFSDAGRVYAREAWPDDHPGVAPAQRWLDHSLALKERLLESPLLQRTSAIVSGDHGTVSSLAVDRRGRVAAGPPEADAGDGTVPLASAAVAGVQRRFAVGCRHEEMMRDDAVLDAVRGLLQEGRCDLPQIEAGTVAAGPVMAPPRVDEATEALVDRVRRRLRRGDPRPADLLFLLDPLRGLG